jgi:hypothetical protein
VAEERVAEGGTRLEASVASTPLRWERVAEGGTRLEASIASTNSRWRWFRDAPAALLNQLTGASASPARVNP